LPMDGFAPLVDHLNAGRLDDASDFVRHAWPQRPQGARCHVTVYCPDQTLPAVRAARGRLPHAHWGISLRGAVSLTYARRNRFALWHETLHLLGAQDHYDISSFRTTCSMPTCLMRYAPSEDTIGDKPCICTATADILRSACK
jgi:hypothetical protein